MEEWRPAVGYESFYEVSNLGRVRSLDRMVPHKGGPNMRLSKGKMLAPIADKDGYLLVSMSADGKSKIEKIHRLVAKAFIRNDGGLPQVNHRNGIKTDNRVDNLEWSSCKDNILHKFRVLGYDSTGHAGKAGRGILDKTTGKKYISEREVIRDIGVGTQCGLSYALYHSGKYYGHEFEFVPY